MSYRSGYTITEEMIIVVCENCSQKLRIPKRKNKMLVTCTICRHSFLFRYYGAGISSSSKKPLIVGLVGSLVGFAVVEIIEATQITYSVNEFFSSMFSLGAFGMSFGACMGAAEGFFRKDKNRFLYGLLMGVALGLISGVISGLIAQFVFGSILSFSASPSFFLVMFARIIGWSILGLLIGVSHGIKENTFGDVKYGLLGGAFGGALGGLLFDPLSFAIQLGNGSVGRLMGFALLGIAINVAVNHLRETAIVRNRPEMYRQLTNRLPINLRLPPPSSHSKY